MFIGHFAVGFAAKNIAPKPSLATYFAGVSFLDLLWSMVLFLVVAYGFDAQGVPPPSEQFIAWAGLSGWILVLWPWWIERQREAISTGEMGGHQTGS